MPPINDEMFEPLGAEIPAARRQPRINGEQQPSCGAYSLTAALAAHEVLPLEAGRRRLVFQTGETLRISEVLAGFSYHQTAQRFFNLTGVLNPKRVTAPGAQEPELQPSGGFNSPAALASIALGFGLEVRIRIHQCALASLGQMFPGEEERCIAAVGEDQIERIWIGGGDQFIDLPGDEQTQLICAATNSGLHWVARGSNGAFYDPSNGEVWDGEDWDLNNPAGFGGLHFNPIYQLTGLMLVLGPLPEAEPGPALEVLQAADPEILQAADPEQEQDPELPPEDEQRAQPH
ncbi:MAG: hypothetical protein AAGM22_29380 [Acidobacteriota bacterium]